MFRHHYLITYSSLHYLITYSSLFFILCFFKNKGVSEISKQLLKEHFWFKLLEGNSIAECTADLEYSNSVINEFAVYSLRPTRLEFLLDYSLRNRYLPELLQKISEGSNTRCFISSEIFVFTPRCIYAVIVNRICICEDIAQKRKKMR